MTASIELQDVTFGYDATRPILSDVRLTIEAGTFLAIVGPNGAGKSTLINLLAGLLRPQSGAISIDGAALHAHKQVDLAQKVALVRQEFVPAFGFSVAETIMMARTPYFGPLGFERPSDRRIVAEAMELTDTTPFAARPLASLSGGERQRVFIARALAQDTPILLLDEPTSFLDLKHQVGIYDLLKSIQHEKARTIVAITHDLNLAAQYCDQALLLLPHDPNRSANPPETHYRAGPPGEILDPEGVERAFGIRVASVQIGRERAILPLGRLAKDAARAGSEEPPRPE